MQTKSVSEGRVYEDFEIGDLYKHAVGRTITQTDNIWFTLLTMNTHPMHFDEEYAKASEFGRCIIASPLTVAMMVGMSVSDVSQKAIANLGWLGTVAARRGDREEAERLAQALAGIERPFLFGEHTIWRAGIAALLGDRERAVGLLRDAFAQGYMFGVHIHRDLNLAPLRGYAPFEELIKPRG